MLTKKTTKKSKDGCKADMYQSGGAANYLEQILGAVNQGNPFAPKSVTEIPDIKTWFSQKGYSLFDSDVTSKLLEYGRQKTMSDDNKSYNEQIPIAQNLGGLFELNQMATDEQLNKKDTLADYTKSISTYAPQGFAEEGGMVDRQAANKFPSLQAILAGLPKEMKAKDKQKVAANAQLELQQILGYKDNSPYKDLPSIDIYSDTIDTGNMAFNIQATSDNGISKTLKPNSGLHYFPGANKVTEVPMAQQGGRVKLKSEYKDRYQYEYDPQTDDYYTTTPEGKTIKVKKGTKADIAIRERYDNFNKGEEIDPFNNKYRVRGSESRDSFDVYGSEKTKDIPNFYRFSKKTGKGRELSPNEVIKAEQDFKKNYGPASIKPVDTYYPVDEFDKGYHYNPVTGEIVERIEEWDDKLNKPVKVDRKVRGEEYKVQREIIRKKGVKVGAVPSNDEYSKREEGFLGRLYNKYLFQEGGEPKKSATTELDYFKELEQYVKTYGFEALEKADKPAAEYYKNVISYGNNNEVLPEITIKAKRLSTKTKKEGSKNRNTTATRQPIYIDTRDFSQDRITAYDEPIEIGRQDPLTEKRLLLELLKLMSDKDRVNGVDQYNEAQANYVEAQRGYQNGGGANVGGKKFIQDWINSPHFTDRLSKNLYELESKNFDNKYEGVLDKYVFQNDATSDAKKLKEEALSKLSGTKEYYGIQGIKDLIKANKISKDVAVDGFQTSSGFYHPYSKSIWLDSKDNDSTRAHESTHATNLDDVLKDLAPSSALYNKIKNEVGLEKDQDLKFRWDDLSVINKDNSVDKEKTKKVLGVLSDYGVSQEKMMYLERSKEVYPHLMQIRYDNNIKPGEVIDEEKMESIFQNSESNNNLFKTYSKKQIMQMLNKFATTGSKIPMNIAQNGGAQNRQMIFNLFKQRPMGRYTDGGFSHRAPSYQFNLPVGNKTKVSGFIDLASLIPIQTEKKELIVLPDGSVVPVNAKQRHSQMTDDQVTDIVPENSYILSQFGQVDIYRSEADQVIIETENKPYNLYGVNPEPRVKTLGDIMNKKVMKPADLGRALTTKYKQIDNAGDPYTQQTNMANKETLSKYLQALIGLSEMDKARKGIDNSMETQMSQGQLPQMVAANGGTVMRSSNVPKAQLGLIAGAGHLY
jgi:hypothetical protein